MTSVMQDTEPQERDTGIRSHWRKCAGKRVGVSARSAASSHRCPEEREEILNYDGPEFLGNPDDKFKL